MLLALVFPEHQLIPVLLSRLATIHSQPEWVRQLSAMDVLPLTGGADSSISKQLVELWVLCYQIVSINGIGGILV